MIDVTVITVVKDDASGLTDTHSSLVSQELCNWEMIIVVGDSSDNTLAVAKNLESTDPRIHLIQQIGEGIYKAMNDGIGLATGNFTWFMNAGDRFFSPKVLSHAIHTISGDFTNVVVGGYQIVGGGNGKAYSFSEKYITWRDLAFTRRAGCHQSMIFRTQILLQLGGFNTTYSLASDFDLLLRVLDISPGKRVSEVYASIEPGGRADKGILQVHAEKHQIRRDLRGGLLVFGLSFLWTKLAQLKISLRSNLQ
jgi:glycosyltransferase involved in cell wall biosynthesis